MFGNMFDGLLYFIQFLFVTIIVLIGCIFFGKDESDYREIVVNELCQKKQYDFCEVSTYKLKTEE